MLPLTSQDTRQNARAISHFPYGMHAGAHANALIEQVEKENQPQFLIDSHDGGDEAVECALHEPDFLTYGIGLCGPYDGAIHLSGPQGHDKIVAEKTRLLGE